MENQQNNHLGALGIGLFFIILVLAITFLRPVFFGKKEKNSMQNTAAEQPEEKDAFENRQLSAEELLSKINSQESVFIIDIREEASFKKEHLTDSRNMLPPDLESFLESFDRNKKYILIGNDGQDALAIIKQLFSEDSYSNISYLAGGFFEWKQKLNPTVNEGNPNSFTDQSKVSYIKSEDLKTLLEKETGLLIIDLRKSATFQDGHIQGAVNIFLDDLEKKRAEIQPGKKIVLVDNDGLWAFQGAVRLFDMGIFNVLALSDGLDGWKGKGFEVVK
ncbi:MAG: hypothetical protein QG620_368 [Patescibacteria group bacterium]|nr:hypothetical protein [Patescibacteria group bacterium]